MTKTLEQFNDTQRAFIEQMGLGHVPANHLEAFFITAEAMHLDPRLKKDIVLIERKTKNGGKTYTIQVGIAGYRKSARKIAKAEGETISVSEWLYKSEDGEWKDTWSFKKEGYPVAARVTVVRDGQPFTQTAMWDEFVQAFPDGKPMALWASKPSYMLGKTAESLAWRQAFPEEMGDTYEESEVKGMTELNTMQQQPPQQQRTNALASAKAEIPQTPAEDDMTDEEKQLLAELMEETSVAELREAYKQVAQLPSAAYLQKRIAERAAELDKENTK